MSDPDLDELQGCGCGCITVILFGTIVLCIAGICYKLIAWCWS